MTDDVFREAVAQAIVLSLAMSDAIPPETQLSEVLLASILLARFTAAQLGISKSEVQKIFVEVFDHLPAPPVTTT